MRAVLLTIASVSALPVATVASLVPAVAPPSATAPDSTASHAPDGSPDAPAHHAHSVGLGRGLLNVHLVAVDALFGGLEQLRHHCLLLEGDEAEALPLVLLLVEGQLHLDDAAELPKVVLDVVVTQVWLEAAHEDLAVPRLCLLGVHLLAIYDVVARVDHLANAEIISLRYIGVTALSGKFKVLLQGWLSFTVNEVTPAKPRNMYEMIT